MKMNLIIHAPNIHRGGGMVLLKALIEASSEGVKMAQLDSRFPAPYSWHHTIISRIQPSLFCRLRAEWQLRKASAEDTILCFGNLPPLFGTRARVFVFLQNRLLVDNASLAAYPWHTKLRLIIERWWLKNRLKNHMQLIVQTQSMRQLASLNLHANACIRSFIPSPPVAQAHTTAPAFDFMYVASGEVHKNHKRLIEAWHLLRAEGLKPSLLLTISQVSEPTLFSWVKQQAAMHDLDIAIQSDLTQCQIFNLYTQCRCLIYPSLMESYGLPLLEATTSGIPILASERDFVRDVCTPTETFDPESAVSISRAVKRFLGSPEQPPCPLSPKALLDWLGQGSPDECPT